jgi:hypothetical protein
MLLLPMTYSYILFRSSAGSRSSGDSLALRSALQCINKRFSGATSDHKYLHESELTTRSWVEKTVAIQPHYRIHLGVTGGVGYCRGLELKVWVRMGGVSVRKVLRLFVVKTVASNRKAEDGRVRVALSLPLIYQVLASECVVLF